MVKKHIVLIRNASEHDFGGGERFPVFLAEILSHNDFEVTVVSRNPKLLAYARERKVSAIRGIWWKKQQWSSWHIILFPSYVLWQVYLYFWYKRLFMQLKPLSVHIQSKDDFIAATYAAKSTGCNVIWTDHADLKHVWMNINVWYKNPIGKWVYRAARKVDAITVVSKSEYTEVVKHLSSTSKIIDKIVVVYNGVSDSFKTHNKPINSKQKIFVFCIIARLVSDKGISEAIFAFESLKKKYPESHLNIIGDGPEAEKFINQAKDIDGITFLGFQSNPLILASQSDCILQPTYHEGFSVALVEACMLEKPIIATAVGGNMEIIQDEKNGLLVPAKDSVSLSTAMLRLYLDRDLRDRLAKNARRTYEKSFIFETIVKQGFIPLYMKGGSSESAS